MNTSAPLTGSRFDTGVLIGSVIALLLVLPMHLLPALLTGLLVYESVHILTPLINARLVNSKRARVIAVALLTTLIVAAVTLTILGLIGYFRHGGLTALLQKLAEIIDSSRNALPAWLTDYLPDSADDLRSMTVDWLREHAGTLQTAGTNLGRGIAYVLIAMIVGAMLSLEDLEPAHDRAPLARALAERVARLSAAFRRVVLAQGWISALNTLLTGLYLVVALPLCGIHLPLAKTLLAITFVVGMLPVIGNLISNSAIVIVSLSQSPGVAIASLVFLVVSHKLGYFLNARIIGGRIRARAWEILMAMLVMEAAFGIGGLVAAPIYYAWLKDELSARGLV